LAIASFARLGSTVIDKAVEVTTIIIGEQAAGDGFSGGAVCVVERESGRAMHFPSYVDPDLILTDYDQVVGDGFADDRDQR
jgi:hypothetical protein